MGEKEDGPKVRFDHDDRIGALWALSVKAKGVSPGITHPCGEDNYILLEEQTQRRNDT